VAGVVVAFLASSDGGGGSSHSPTVTGLEVDAPETPDRICVEFTIERGEGPYSAKVEFVRVSENNFPPTAATQLSGFTAPCQATPKRIVFVWDAKSDLNDEAAIVQIIVTPMGKTATGKQCRTPSFRAGNTPLQVRSGAGASSRRTRTPSG